jgi:polysaccharide export outer membrane protein
LASRAFLQGEVARLGNDPGAARIRARLENGDFQVGDQIFIQVQGDSVLTDTFTVVEGVELPLPQLAAIPLRGVLRSELKDKVVAHLSQFLRDPAVDVKPLMRVVVEGQVNKPGFYAAAPEQPLAEVINAAGGFTQQAKVTDIRLQRGTTTLLSGRKLQEALGQGLSLDRLSLRPGDRVFVPQRADSERTLRIVGLILSVPVGILALTRVF